MSKYKSKKTYIDGISAAVYRQIGYVFRDAAAQAEIRNFSAAVDGCVNY